MYPDWRDASEVKGACQFYTQTLVPSTHRGDSQLPVTLTLRGSNTLLQLPQSQKHMQIKLFLKKEKQYKHEINILPAFRDLMILLRHERSF